MKVIAKYDLESVLYDTDELKHCLTDKDIQDLSEGKIVEKNIEGVLVALSLFTGVLL